MSLKNLPSASELDSYLAMIDAHPFAALLVVVAAVAIVWVWRRPNPN